MSDQRTIDTFIELVKINSTSRHEANIREYLQKFFKKQGHKTRVDKKGNLHISIKGLQAHGPVIMFNAHMDTVVPGNNIQPVIKQDRIVSDGTTILGADDKVGLAALLEMTRRLKEKKKLFHKIKLLLTVEEESGLRGAKKLTFNDVEADYCFVLDSDGDVGSIITHAPAQDGLEIKIKGQSAHAGLCPEKGISAIKIAGEAIAKIKVGRIDKETTANIGIIKGGRATNIVPDEVTIKAEARSHNEEKLARQVKHMTAAFEAAAEKNGGQAEIKVTRAYNCVATSPNSEIVQIAKAASAKLGLKCKVGISGGGSDASVIYSYGIPTIALCIGMEQVHSKKEYVTLKNLTGLPKYLLAIIDTANKHGQ